MISKIPFPSELLVGLIFAALASYGTAHYLNLKHAKVLSDIKEVSQDVRQKATEVVVVKTEKASTITAEEAAKLSKELTDANTKIAALHRGIANGTIGMRVNVLSRQGTGVQGAGDSTAVREVTSAELDPKTASALVDITDTGDQYAIKYNSLYAWCSAQINNQRE